MSLQIFVASLLCSYFQYGQAQIGMGPLNIKLVKFTECPADEQLFRGEIVSLDDGSDGMNIDVNLPFDFDDTISYSIRVDKVQNGQVQKGVFKNSANNACENLNKYLGKIYENIVSAMGSSSTCPISAGTYHAANFKFNQNDIGLKTFLYGRFLLYAELFKGNRKLTCTCLEFTNSRPGESV